jgi:hypothetical protein
MCIITVLRPTKIDEENEEMFRVTLPLSRYIQYRSWGIFNRGKMKRVYTVLRKGERRGGGKMKGRGNYWEGGGFHRINKERMFRGAGILCTEPKLEFTNAKHFN